MVNRFEFEIMFTLILEFLTKILKNVQSKGFFHLFSASLFVKLIAFGSQFFVAWWLTVEEIGDIKILQSYFSLATVFALFGFNSSLLKLCSENRPVVETIALYRYGKSYVRIVVIIVVPTLIILSIFGFISPNTNIRHYFPLILIALYPAVMNEIDSVYLQARKHIKLLALRQISVKSISLVLILFLTYLFSFNGYIIGYVLSFYFSFFVFYYFVRKINRDILPSMVTTPFFQHWKYSKFALLTLILGQLSTYADVFIMNYTFESKAEIGYYSFALLLMLIPGIFTGVVQSITVPFISNKSDDMSAIQNIYKKYQRLNIVASLIIAILLLLIVPIIVRLVFKEKFADSIDYFLILVVAWFIGCFIQLKGLILWGIGLIKFNFYNSVISIFVKYVCCIIFVKYLGTIGLAIGILISNIVEVMTISVFYKNGLLAKQNEILRYEKDSTVF